MKAAQLLEEENAKEKVRAEQCLQQYNLEEAEKKRLAKKAIDDAEKERKAKETREARERDRKAKADQEKREKDEKDAAIRAAEKLRQEQLEADRRAREERSRLREQPTTNQPITDMKKRKVTVNDEIAMDTQDNQEIVSDISDLSNHNGLTRDFPCTTTVH